MNQPYSYYIAKSNEKILDNDSKRYVLRIRDLPPDKKPREKLLAHGPSALSISELLAVVLNVGTKKEGVLAMASRLIKEYGEKSVLSQKNPAALAKEFNIPIVKAAQVVACAELGRRLFQKNDLAAPTIRTATEVFEYAKEMGNLSKEHLRGLYLNAHYKLIHDEVISIGTVDANIIHPREVFKPAIEYSAAAVILVHNHPSGNAQPSQNDVEVTKKLAQAGRLLGIDLADHIIVAKGGFMSIPVE